MKRFAVLLVAALAIGCSGGETESVECQIDSLMAGDLVSGEVQVEVGFEGPVTRVEILVGSTAVASADVTDSAAGTATVAWNTEETADGEAEVTARVEGEDSEALSDAVTVTVDNTAPVVSVDIERLSVVQGTVDVPITVDEANVEGLRLLAGDVEIASLDEAVESISWDTTEVEPHVYRLTLEVTDAAGNMATSEEVPVAVANGGEEADVQWATSAWIIIPDPFDPTAEVHTRAVVPMDERPIRRVMAWLTWDEASDWELEFAIGQGICPHRGVKYLDGVSDSGEVILEVDWVDLDPALQAQSMSFDEDHPADATYFPYNGDPATCGAFFGHAADTTPADHAGMELEIDVHFVFIFDEE